MASIDATLDDPGVTEQPTKPRGEMHLGLSAGVPVAVAVSPVGVAFGVLVVHSGLPWWWATVFATVIFAGSLEFVLIGMVTTLAPFSQIALTAFLVNFRHVFYALTFPMHQVRGVHAKAYSTFTLTDEAYALTTSTEAQSWSRRRLLALQAAFQVMWICSATLGAIAGGLIPPAVVGLDFTVTAFFVVLAIEAHLTGRDVPGGLVAIGLALIARTVAGNGMLALAMGAFAIYLVLRYCYSRTPADA